MLWTITNLLSNYEKFTSTTGESVADFAQNRQKSYFFVICLIVIILNRWLNTIYGL